MDRERDRDTAEALIEEADKEMGGRFPDRERPGQGDAASRPVDGSREPTGPEAEVNKGGSRPDPDRERRARI